jgi:polyisoprenoid-binding protein YceI
MNYRRSAILSLALLATPVWAKPVTYLVSANDSSTVNFTMRCPKGMVEGRFQQFGAQIVYDRLNYKGSSVNFSVQSTRVATDNKQRDEAIRSFQCLDTHRFPKIEFHSKEIVWRGKNKMDVIGDLSIHGVTRRLTASVTDLGNSPGLGREVETFETEFVLKPRDFGVPINHSLDPGGTVLTDEVPVKLVMSAAAQ